MGNMDYHSSQLLPPSSRIVEKAQVIYRLCESQADEPIDFWAELQLWPELYQL